VVLDDIGVDKIGAYDLHDHPAPTPTLDGLAADGVRFDAAWATPMCSPTRAALLTGRLPGRTGVGELIAVDESQDWLDGEDTLPKVLARSPHGAYTSALTGKWHLGAIDDVDHPARAGFAHHAGSMNNPGVATESDGARRGYSHWQKNTDGALAFTDTYMTTDTVDDAIDQLRTLPEPWLLYVPFNAAHVPWHLPPDDLHDLTPGATPSNADKLDMMIAALDTELGRLLDAMTAAQRASTTIVVVGDNGTNGDVTRPPVDPDRGKGTLFEGGIRVPLIVVSPLVAEPGRTSDALVHVVDVLPTAAELAAVDLDDGVRRDGRSWMPLLTDPDAPWDREFLVSQHFAPNGFDPTTRGYAVRDDRYNLIATLPADTAEWHHRLFDLGAGSLDEGPDLLESALSGEAQQAYDRLTSELDALDAELYGP
jgi:arylsulfatase A-like enzyme